LITNPVVEMPLGEYEHLRVKTALVRSADYDEKKLPRLTCSEDAYKIVKDSTVEPQECMYIILMNTSNRVIGVHEVYRGGLSSMIIEPSRIFQAAIVANAHAIILAHNHPSGNPKPSPHDTEMALEISELGQRLGIRVLDFLVVGYESYESLADQGVI
jgi:DNA repair protein RadC